MSWRILLSVVVACVLLLSVKAAVGTGGEAVGTQKLAKKRVEAARHAYEAAWAAFKPFDLSKGDGENVYRWSRRWMESERHLATTKAKRVAAFESHLERMKKLEKEVHDYGLLHNTIPVLQMAATTFYRAEAETWLAEEQAQ
jgi:hypothetical protein